MMAAAQDAAASSSSRNIGGPSTLETQTLCDVDAHVHTADAHASPQQSTQGLSLGASSVQWPHETLPPAVSLPMPAAIASRSTCRRDSSRSIAAPPRSTSASSTSGGNTTAPFTSGCAVRFQPIDDATAGVGILDPKPVASKRTLSFSRAPRGIFEGPQRVQKDTDPGPGSYEAPPVELKKRRASSPSFGTTPRGTSIVLLKSGMQVSVSSEPLYTRPLTSGPPLPGRTISTVVPKDQLLRRAPSAIFQSSPRFRSSATDVPGPGSYGGGGNSSCAEASTSRPCSPRRARNAAADGATTPSALDSVSNNDVNGSLEVNPATPAVAVRSRSAPRRTSPWAVSSGRNHQPVFSVRSETPGPGAYAGDVPSAPPRASSVGCRIGTAPRPAAFPISRASRESSMASSRQQSSSRPQLPESTLIRKSSNVFLKRSQERWDKVQAPGTSSRLGCASTRTSRANTPARARQSTVTVSLPGSPHAVPPQ